LEIFFLDVEKGINLFFHPLFRGKGILFPREESLFSAWKKFFHGKESIDTHGKRNGKRENPFSTIGEKRRKHFAASLLL